MMLERNRQIGRILEKVTHRHEKRSKSLFLAMRSCMQEEK